jgi:hypothetical protein
VSSLIECHRQPSQDREVNVQLDPLNPANAKREQRPFVLEVAELALNRPALDRDRARELLGRCA